MCRLMKFKIYLFKMTLVPVHNAIISIYLQFKELVLQYMKICYAPYLLVKVAMICFFIHVDRSIDFPFD